MTHYVEDLVPAPDSGIVALVMSEGSTSDTTVAPLRGYLVGIPSSGTTRFPAFVDLPEPIWIDGAAKGRPAVIFGSEGELVLSVPGRHSIFRLPRSTLNPAPVACGTGAAAVDRATRAAFPEARARADMSAPDAPVSTAGWRAALTGDSRRAAKTATGLDDLGAELPVALGPAVDRFRDVLDVQQKAIEARLKKAGTIDTEHRVATFRAQLIFDSLVAANGVRELCGLPRLDFDLKEVWGAARNPTVQ